MLPCSHRSGFTLIELLIVIAIVAVLAVIIFLVLNPAELLKQSRDSNRLSDMNTLNRALALYQTDVPSGSLGTTNKVYVSVPDTSSTCANLALPALPSGWTYGCAATSTLRNVDGTGWLPVDFTQVSSGSPLPGLPVDPVNSTSTGLYYTYTAGAGWEINAAPESRKFRVVVEGGDNPFIFEAGSDLALNPRSGTPITAGLKFWFDANYGITRSGTAVSSWDDQSGNDNNATQSNAINQPTFATSSINGLPAIQIRNNSGYDFLVIGNSFLLKQVFIVYKSPHSTFDNYGTPLGIQTGQRVFIFENANTFFHSNPGCSGGAWKNGVALSSPCDMAPITNYMILTVNTAYPTEVRQYAIGGTENGTYVADLDIAEIIGYDTVLSASDRQTVESYLNAKYAIY